MKQPNFLTIVLFLLVSTLQMKAQNTASLPSFPKRPTYAKETVENSNEALSSNESYNGQAVYPDSILVEYFDVNSQNFRRHEFTSIQWRPDLKPSSISTKNYQTGIFSHVNEYRFDYDAAGELKEYDYFTNLGGVAFKEKYEQHLDAFGELASLRQFILFEGQWQIGDHFLLQYDRLQGKIKEVRYFDAYANNLKNVRKYSDIIWNNAGQLLGFKVQSANLLQTNWDTVTTHYRNLDWQAGYGTLLFVPQKINASHFTPRFPLLIQNYRPMPTSLNLYRYMPSDTIHLRNVAAGVWNQNRLLSTLRMVTPTGVMDTVSQTIFERDAEGRLVYLQQNAAERTAAGLVIRPHSARAWQFDAEGKITRFTQYHGYSSSHWSDSVVQVFTYTQHHASRPQVWTVVDSLLLNGQMQANSRSTFYFSTVAASDHAVRAAELKLYPNPARNEINLQWESLAEGNVQVKIFNSNGQELMNAPFNTEGRSNLRLELPALKPGIYLVQLEVAGKSMSQRLVIQ